MNFCQTCTLNQGDKCEYETLCYRCKDDDDPFRCRPCICPDYTERRPVYTLETITWELGTRYDLGCIICAFEGRDSDAIYLLDNRYPICAECADPEKFKGRLPCGK